MSFQTKLIITYSILIVLLIGALSLVFYQYNSNTMESKAYTNLTVISDKMSQQLDNLVKPMDFITYHLLSYNKFITSMSTLAYMDKHNNKNLIYINESRENINSVLMGYSVGKNFYRVSVFNDAGEFFTSKIDIQSVSGDIGKTLKSIEWIPYASDKKGHLFIISPYLDPWAVTNKQKVFGVSRSVQGSKGQMGYIEVQNSYTELENIFSSEDNISVVAVTQAGEIFYNSGITDASILEYYSNLAQNSDEEVYLKKNTVTGLDEIIACQKSEYTGIKFLLIQSRQTILKPIVFTRNIILIIGFLVIIVSITYIYFFARQLTKPIRQLKHNMESTELENLATKYVFEKSNNEIEALNKSFKYLKTRLNEAVQREITLQSLQMQANFDSLQAQVNPHFIYNILNVLSNKGIENGDEEICEICSGIASMLRYSTSTLERSSTVAAEIEHVKNYLTLMKKRFEHKLEFSINIEEGIFKESIPKIVLQQIVENSISHGFDNKYTTMIIDVKGYVSEECWFIEISDNGQGFNEEVLESLEIKMQDIRKELKASTQLMGFAIGGMGIINTYARLFLYFGDRLIFLIENKTTGGAKITIGSTIFILEEGDLIGNSNS